MSNGTIPTTEKPTIATTPGLGTTPPEHSLIEIAVCETISGTGVISHGVIPKKSSATYHVEVRFVPFPGAHSICFRGDRYRDRMVAEVEKIYVESVFKIAMLKKPKPVKERKRTKRARSRRS